MKEFYIIKDGLQVGPYSSEQLKKMLSNNQITEDTVAKVSSGAREGTFVRVGAVLQGVSDRGCQVATLLSLENGGNLRVACPVCGQHYQIPESMAKSEKYSCVKCDNDFTLPPRSSMAEFNTAPGGAELEMDIPEGDLLCPHCWKSFDQDYILYISVHPSLYGDPVLGEYVPKRFVPTVFNQAGQPLDERGVPATEMACPRCHLRIPAGLLDTPSLYFSIAGATSSGKSYFLTCLIHRLRQILPEYFNAAFFDADPRLNETLNFYEKQLFMSLSPHEITSLPATQIAGEGISDRIRLDGIEIELPKPFVFEFREKDASSGMNMIFYDNSGEMFIPGRDDWGNQATYHLSHSNGIMFLFDPTNDASMRLAICDRQDPQVSQNPRVVDQTILLNEMISRIRRHSNMISSENCKIPLVIVVGKYDAWSDAFPINLSEEQYITKKQSGLHNEEEEYLLAKGNIQRVSYALREMMLEYVPGLVNTAESFFEEVYFVPISNFGTLAEQNSDGAIGVVPSKINSVWVDTPLLLLLSENGHIAAEQAESSMGEPLGKIIKNKIVFTHPVSDKIIRLPLCYAGAVIEINDKLYRFPKP